MRTEFIDGSLWLIWSVASGKVYGHVTSAVDAALGIKTGWAGAWLAGSLGFAAEGLEGLKQQEAPISTAAAPRRGYLP